MRILFSFLLIFMSLGVANSQTSVIDQELNDHINSLGVEEMMDVNIILKSKIDSNTLGSLGMRAADKKAGRDLVVSELKKFSEKTQSGVMSILQAEERGSNVVDITTHWLVNMINCTATADVIYTLAEHPDVEEIFLNKEENMIWDEDKVENIDLSRGMTSNITQVKADKVWEAGYTGKGVVVAVIDSGVNYNHVDLADHLWDGGADYPHHGYDFVNNDNDPMDDHSHGTHCAGTVCGDGTSGTQTGIAPDATLMCIKVLSSSGSGSLDNIISGVEFAVEHGADVLSLSLGSTAPKSSVSETNRETFINVLQANVIAAVAAGNDGEAETYPRNINSPGNCPPPWLNPDQKANPGGLSAVVCVGAVDSNGNKADFSSQGPVTWQATEWADYKYEYKSGLKNTNGWLHYDTGEYWGAVGNTFYETVKWGIMFTAEDLQSHKNSYMTKVSVYDCVAHTGNILIYKGGDNAPEELIHSQPYTCTGAKAYVEFDLTKEILIEADKNIWVVMNNDNEIYVAAGSTATHDKNGRWFCSDGTNWMDILNNLKPLQYTWMLRAYVNSGAKSNEDRLAENDFGLIRPDISAPGVSIQSCSHKNNTGHTYKSGTSMATPCIAGIMALMLEKNPSLTPAEICEMLETTTQTRAPKNNDIGSGCVDALAAVTKVTAEDDGELVAPELVLTEISSDSVRLDWTKITPATSYNVYLNGVKVKTITTNTCIIDGLIYNYTDRFKVSSVRGATELYSNEVKRTKGINDFFVIDYENYSLKFTIKKLSVKEVSVACYIAPTANVELYMPNVATTKDNMDFSVVEIDQNAFKGTSFTNVVISDNIRKIGERAFEKCSVLTIITFPNNDSITLIPSRMFYDCKKLHTIHLPQNLQKISNSSFYNCDGIKSMSFPNTLKEITYRGFSNCDNLEYISLQEGMVSIANEAFINCKKLKKVISTAVTVPKIDNTPNEQASFGDLYPNEGWGVTGNINLKIYVPCDVIDEYKEKWYYYKDHIYGLPRFITDGYLSDENNWTCLPEGGLAACTDVLIEAHAIIKSDEVIEIETFTCTSNGQITIEEGGQIIHDFGGGNVNISKTIAPYVVGDEGYLDSGWYILSSPFVRTDVAPLLVNNYELFRYDEPTYNWENVKNAANNFVELERGRGYIYANANATTLKMSGELNTGTVYQDLTASGELLTGFNLIANPYMHNIYKGDKKGGTAIFDKNNRISTGFYTLTNDGAWQPKTDKTDPIGPTEGILIKTKAAMTLSINQTTSNGATRSSSKSSFIKIKVENAKYEDVAYVLFEDDVIGLDKINHRNPDIPMLYIREGNEIYAIAVKEKDVEEIPLTFEAKKMGEYTISVSAENYPCSDIVLVDNKNGNTIDILKETYTFLATSSDMPERFTMKISHNDESNIVVYTKDNNIVIDNMNGDAVINVYDIKGCLVARYNTADSRYMINTAVMSDGLYIVNVIDDKGVHTQKVVK